MIEQLIEDIEWTGADQVTVSSDLDLKTQDKLRQFLKKHEYSFAKNQNDLGTCTVGDVRIETRDHAPIFTPPYPLDDKKTQAMKKLLQEMVDAGIVRLSKQCAWGSPAVIVPKKDGSFRFCVNYQKVNKITETMHFPLPLISEILRRLGRSCFFKLLDLKNGFWQIKVHPDSIAKTAVVVPWAIYEFLKLPFGLKNSPGEFSRIMFIILGDLVFVEIYIDDIAIHSRTIKEHFEHIAIVFERLRQHNMKLNMKKCIFFAKEINILGHTVSGQGIRMDKSKIETVKRFPTPANARQVQVFLGLTGYYRSFIRSYAEIASPLNELTKKGSSDKPQTTKKRKQDYYVPFIWSKDCEESFQTLKQRLCEDPILVQFNPNLPRRIYTDSSGYAAGVILSSVNEIGKEQVLAYASRLFKNAEKNYTISEKELLAILFALRKFHSYIVGTQFEIFTDHIALQSAFKVKDIR